MQEYLQLRLEGWDWRKAAYIAWASSPRTGRWPATQAELATQVLGLRSDRTIRTWIEKDPSIEERVARMQVEPLMQWRRDVIMALIQSSQVIGKNGAPDRRTYFTLTGDLKPGKGQDQEKDRRAQTSPIAAMSDEELEQVIRNLQLALSMAPDSQEEDEDDLDSDEA